jgi:hypothetical protein
MTAMDTSWPWMKDCTVATTPALPAHDRDDRPALVDEIAASHTKAGQVAAALASDPLYQPNKHDDLWIEHFLLSHKRNVTAAIKAAPYTLQFRTKHKLDKVDICYSPIGPNCEPFQKFHDYCSGDTFVVMCCVMMEVLPDDVTPSHDVAYTTEQCHDSPRSGSPQRPQGPAWID